MWVTEDAQELNPKEGKGGKGDGSVSKILLTKDTAYNGWVAFHKLRTISHRQHPRKC